MSLRIYDFAPGLSANTTHGPVNVRQRKAGLLGAS